MIIGKYWCPRKERYFERTRLDGGAKQWRSVPWFLRSYQCWGCRDDCHKGRYHKEAKE
jgi:hypothetical protein